ncbi:MAG: methionyl-tRNA formyltransferase [Betaproteobacteria bacterium]|nr:methionyl-tRNA formyltransferase [Betaproteobacteria bacterium]
MNLVFAGTPEFAAVALEALIGAGHTVKLVLTQPDRPAGRGLRPRSSAVKRVAQRHALPLLQPSTLKDEGTISAISALRPDAMVVAAYGLIVPKAVLRVPRLGCINIHASLLPRWRGAAPIQRALLAGDATTGITIMQMDEGLDTGPTLLQHEIAIGADDTAQSLHDRLAALGAELVVRALAMPLTARPQDGARATHAPKITREETRIDWNESAAVAERKVRAFTPIPGAYTMLNGAPLKIWRAKVEPGASGFPGEVIERGAAGIVVGCGEDALRVFELQRAGGRRVAAEAFLAGFDLAIGERMGA